MIIMANVIASAISQPFARAWDLLNSYIDVCPENIWAEKNGGWPVWQQIAHAVMVADWLVSAGNEELLPTPCDRDVASLKTQGTRPVAKTAMKDYAASVKKRVDAWFVCLADENLPELNAALTKIVKRDMPYAAVAVMLASHTNYHLGSCDAALRDHGLPGVF
jgi:hypothetical protein